LLIPPIDKCPYCSSTEGFYTKDYIKGSTTFNHNYDGTEAENGEYYEFLDHTQGKYAYCISCDKRLFAMTEVVDIAMSVNEYRYMESKIHDCFFDIYNREPTKDEFKFIIKEIPYRCEWDDTVIDDQIYSWIRDNEFRQPKKDGVICQ
jgi:hypothetical protein